MDGYAAYARHVNPGLGRFLELSGRDVRFVSGRDTVLEDADGVAWDDWIAGFGSLNLGHNPPAIKAALAEHLAGCAPGLFVESLNPFAGELAARLVALAGERFETCFLSNSGAEAIEAALKTALLATRRPRIAYAEGGYHGTTLGALACMARGPYRADLDSVLAAFRAVPFNDAAALEKALAEGDVAAFLVEPIQMEAGARIAESGYLHAAREACRRHGALLIFDEVQTGLGRTGALFAWQHAGVEPDVLVSAKALGGGLVPIGATLMARGLWERAYPGYLRAEIHNSTFGGNALACRAALATLDVVADPAFLDSVRRRGEALFSSLRAALSGTACVERITGRGLLGGIALRGTSHPWTTWENLGLEELAGHPTAGALVVERLARRRILAQVCAHDWSVVRVEPPLTVDDATCARFVDAVAEAVRWLEQHG
jgi:acetylornithine/succinyldiaminopimelate/putrescine aminotransferase